MKATELMIGDWVLMDKNYSEEDPMYTRLNYQPYQIQNGEDIDLACETNCIGDADVYQPIPITPDILERNGFEKVQNLLVLQWENGVYPSMIFVEYNPENYCLFINDMMFPKPVRFLHELHHILMDCGIEKEITP